MSQGRPRKQFKLYERFHFLPRGTDGHRPRADLRVMGRQFSNVIAFASRGELLVPHTLFGFSGFVFLDQGPAMGGHLTAIGPLYRYGL